VSVEGSGVRKDVLSTAHKSEKMVLALLESASQAIISIDRNGRIVLANPRAEQMFNYTRDELVGARVEMLLPDGKRASHGRQRDDYFKHPRARPMGIGLDLWGRRRDGTEFPVEVSLSNIETEEGLFGIAFVSDISQRKQLEEQLVHAQKMEAVGRLAGGVAHDFNNMLTVISGYNRMILDELSPLDPLHDYAEEIAKAAERAGAITNQLLAFSRRQVIQPRVINVNTVLAQTEKMLRRLLGEDIQLTLNLPDGVGNIQADPNQIEQAIVNLAVNSRHAMPTGGHIVIETGNVHLDEDYIKTHLGVTPGDFVMVSVTDTGHGMDALTKSRVFEPFFTTKERGKGTGLGLASVYGMVKQSGGDIWVYSEPGRGTTFRLYFPRIAEAVNDTQTSETREVERSGAETVLVVEDEKPVRDLTVRMLQQLGYSVLSASSGEEAIAISHSYGSKISLLLTDVVMPQMSGRQVADALSTARPDLKVLYLSGYTGNTVIHHGVESDVNFLPKPFSREALSKKVTEVLSKPVSNGR
jgi:two-component system, cell cycle sensor histidine kinase and response regulator CckA